MDERPARLREHDPEWSARFESERDRLRPILDDYTTRIEHVGSTSVPGLAAKPIVDLTAVVDDLKGCWGDLDQLSVWYGYAISSVPGDWLLLQRTAEDGQAYNLHLIEEDNDRWERDLLFREYLRSHPEAREEYERVKREAASAHPEDIDAYNAKKSDCVQSILDRAVADDEVTVPEPGD